MLDAACAGAVFTSPVPDQMAAATKAVSAGAGVVHIVKNYTGDVLNFRMAAELSEDDGIEVATVADGRRLRRPGLALHGRAAAAPAPPCWPRRSRAPAPRPAARWPRWPAVATRVNAQARSFGVALTSCATPGKGTPIFDLGPDEIEVGVGIHGEPGRRRVPHTTAAEIAEMMLTPILDDLDPAPGSSVLAFVNGLGGTPLIEQYILFNEVAKQLAERRRHDRPVARRLLHHEPRDGRRLGHAARARRRADGAVGRARQDGRAAMGRVTTDGVETAVDAATVTRWMRNCADVFVEQRDYLTQLDAAIGDADHGANMTRGFSAVEAKLDGLDGGTPPGRILVLAGSTLVSTVGGASGPLWGSALPPGRQGARRRARPSSPAELAAALDAARRRRGRARRGRARRQDDGRRARARPSTRSAASLDAGRIPGRARSRAARAAAEEGMRATVPMLARKGRASYLGERSIGHQDPGATSTALIIAALEQAVVPGERTVNAAAERGLPCGGERRATRNERTT